MTAVLANMVEAALAGGLLAVSELEEVNGDAWGTEGDGVAPATCGGRIHSTINADAGPGAHRVDSPPVRAGAAGGPVGLARRRHRGHRRRPGTVRAQHHPPGRVVPKHSG